MNGKQWFLLSAGGFLIASLSVFFLPLAPDGEGEAISTGARIIGTIFWLGILLGIVGFLISWKYIRGEECYQEIRRMNRPGWCSFFSNQYAKAADLLLVVAVVLAVLENTLLALPAAVNLFTIFLLLFTFCMHFVLNGRVYRYFSMNARKGS